MAGIPKSTRELKITGAYRKDRHGDRADPELTPGQPAMPRTLTDRCSKDMWNRLAPSLYRSKIATQEDALALTALCEWWSEWRKAYRAMQRAEDLDDKLKAQSLARRAWPYIVLFHQGSILAVDSDDRRGYCLGFDPLHALCYFVRFFTGQKNGCVYGDIQFLYRHTAIGGSQYPGAICKIPV